MSEVISKFDILGVKISAINIPTALNVIERHILNRQKGYVCVCPVSTIMDCQDNPRLLQIVNEAVLATPDGMPTVWIAQSRGLKDVRRVYGPDLMLAVCGLSEEKGYRHFFYGGTPEVIKELTGNLQKKFPRLQVAGSFAPPFRPLSEQEKEDVINRVNRVKPDILWVGLGSPKQDLWMDEYKTALDVPIMLGVGAAFDFISGAKNQASKWVQNAGLEWLFRLCCEPQRLWRRYLIGNTKFVYLLLKESITSQLRTRKKA